MSSGRIGIAVGDVTGIGPEVTLKALAIEARESATDYTIIGDCRRLFRLNQELGLNLPLELVESGKKGRFLILDPCEGLLPQHLAPGESMAAQAAMLFLRHAAIRCSKGEFDALVTAPVNKESIIRAGYDDFVGQTEFLSTFTKAERTAMMLLGHDERHRWLRVALVTTHLPIKSVASAITQPKVELAIDLAHQACADLGLGRAKIAVCGLNPHAGEGGKIGSEEVEVIIPAVQAAKSRGVDVTGPIAADTLFYYALRGHFDAVVAMYHDQGLAPLKMIAFESGVNWTLGLPIIRTSPDHGTAYDIAGQGKADPASMLSAMRLARQLADRKQRQRS